MTFLSFFRRRDAIVHDYGFGGHGQMTRDERNAK